MPGNSRTKTKKTLRNGNVEFGWGRRSCGLLFFDFFLFSFFECVLAFTGGGASAALLQKVHFCFAMPSYCRSEFRVLIYMAYCGRKEHQRKEDGYIGWQFVFKSSKRKVGCAMLRYDFLNWDLVRGGSCGSSLLGFIKLLFSHYFENSLLAGGLGCSSAKSSVFTSLWLGWTMNGCRIDGCRQEINSWWMAILSNTSVMRNAYVTTVSQWNDFESSRIFSRWWSARWTVYQLSMMLSVQLPGLCHRWFQYVPHVFSGYLG